MKTISNKACIVIGAMILALGTTSCSKSYNCHCTYKSNGTVTHEEDRTINEGKKEKTAASCDQGDNSNTVVLNGNSTVNSTECELTN